MGFINILNASVEGKLGEMYGVKQYGKHFAKAIPFSHSPFTEKQKKAYSNFSLLQKFCSGQWRAMKGIIPLRDPKLLPQNILAKEYKQMIQGAFFNLENIYEVCEKLTTVEIIKAEYYTDEKRFYLEYDMQDNSIDGIPQETMLTCYDQEIYCVLSSQAFFGKNVITFFTDREEILDPYFIFTQYRKKKKGWGVVGALAVKVNIVTENA